MLRPTFQISLKNPCIKGLATVGKFDGKHPSLACATSADNILVHSPHQRNASNEHEIRQLSMKQEISALTSGPVKNKKETRDVLLVGSPTSMMAYDVENNSDIVFKDVSEGVSAIIFGSIEGIKEPLIVVGGNCSLYGFDSEGNEAFWSVTGDIVSALAVRKNDGVDELLVGSEDFEIRVFRKEEVVTEITESDVVVGFAPIELTTFGYALGNGSLGVYQDETRVWHAKSKHKITSITAFDLFKEGYPQLVAGWSNGRFEVRAPETGELLFKDRFSDSVASILVSDYRMNGSDEVLALTTNGEIRGYIGNTDATANAELEVKASETALKSLYNKKNALLQELKGFEKNAAQLSKGQQAPGTIPADTKIDITMKPSLQNNSIVLTLATNNECVIKLALLFSEVLFEEESHVACMDRPGTTLSIPLIPNKNQEAEMTVKAVVGHRSSTQDHVFEVDCRIPRFGHMLFTPMADLVDVPKAHCTLLTTERVNRVSMYLSNAFCADSDNPLTADMMNATVDGLKAGFTSIRPDRAVMVIEMAPEDSQYKLTFWCDDMELVGDVIQDMCRSVRIETLEALADFPHEMEGFLDVLKDVESHNSTRLKMSAQIADSSNLVKTLVIKAEDARICGDIQTMAKMYSQLFDLNGELIGEYNKRALNHQALLNALKEVNIMIQKSARLRMGTPKTNVISACRKAIKANLIQELFRIMSLGDQGGGSAPPTSHTD